MTYRRKSGLYPHRRDFSRALIRSLLVDIPIFERVEPPRILNESRRGNMSLVDKLHHGSKSVITVNFDFESTKRRLRLLATVSAAILTAAVLVIIFIAGHPIISIWLAGAILSWLFVLGATKASEPDSADRE